MHQPFRQMSEDSRGLVKPKSGKERPDHQPRHQPNRPYSQTNLPKPSLHHLPLIPLKRNVVNSPSCSVTWWTPRNSPPSSTQKSTGKSSVPINRLVLISSSDTMLP